MYESAPDVAKQLQSAILGESAPRSALREAAKIMERNAGQQRGRVVSARPHRWEPAVGRAETTPWEEELESPWQPLPALLHPGIVLSGLKG
ncbi:hypothetical protein GCM10009780_55950 [Actinomadura alba]